MVRPICHPDQLGISGKFSANLYEFMPSLFLIISLGISSIMTLIDFLSFDSKNHNNPKPDMAIDPIKKPDAELIALMNSTPGFCED